MLKQLYVDNALSRTRVCEWYTRFWDVHENLEGDESNGQPTAVRTPDMIETVRELISADHLMTLRMMEEELEISRETIRRILMGDLGKRNICPRFVPRCWMNRRLSDCEPIKNLFNLSTMILACWTQL
jgi:hypothetical protein